MANDYNADLYISLLLLLNVCSLLSLNTGAKMKTRNYQEGTYKDKLLILYLKNLVLLA